MFIPLYYICYVLYKEGGSYIGLYILLAPSYHSLLSCTVKNLKNWRVGESEQSFIVHCPIPYLRLPDYV